MIPKSGNRFSEKIMLEQRDENMIRVQEVRARCKRARKGSKAMYRRQICRLCDGYAGQ
jgi:hypothetical protein